MLLDKEEVIKRTRPSQSSFKNRRRMRLVVDCKEKSF